MMPQLRFNEFDGQWEKRLLGDIFTFKNGVNASKEQYGHGVKFINVLDIINNNFITYENIIGSVNITATELAKNDVEYGDILFQRSSETREEVGQSNVYLGQKPVSFGGFVIRGRGLVKYDALFFHYALKTDSVRDEITQRSGGSTRYNIGQESLSVVPIVIPSIAEQTKIASFLTAVDEKLAKLTRKQDLLTQYKKGVMQQIFSQELRFKDNDGQEFPEWEETYIGKVLTIGSGKDYKHLSAGEIPVYGTGGYMLSVNNYLYDGESVCIGRKGTIDKPTLLSGKFWTVDTLFYTHTFKNCLPKFIYAYFQTIDWKNYNEASGVPSLSKSTIENIEIRIPVEAEQTKIAAFLTAIDDKIGTNRSQLAAAKQYKQGLLQQLFV